MTEARAGLSDPWTPVKHLLPPAPPSFVQLALAGREGPPPPLPEDEARSEDEDDENDPLEWALGRIEADGHVTVSEIQEHFRIRRDAALGWRRAALAAMGRVRNQPAESGEEVLRRVEAERPLYNPDEETDEEDEG